MEKLYLPARVPNEGARQLAQWLLKVGVEAASVSLRRSGVSLASLDRLLLGEVVPGERIAVAVALVTGGKISRRLWRQKPIGWWFDSATDTRRAA